MTIMATINELLFPIFLFIVIFCFLICLTYNQQNQSCEEIERIDDFTNEIKEAFSVKFDPEPIIITQDNQRKKTHNKKIMPLNNNTNPKHSTPSSQLTEPDFTNMKVKDLKEYIKQHNLQESIKLSCGKSVSKCRKAELIDALN
jgi:hypothetical protein